MGRRGSFLCLNLDTFTITLGCQGPTALLPETIAKEGDPEGLRPTQVSDKDPMEDWKEITVLIPPEPLFPQGPAEGGYRNFSGVSDPARQPTSSSLVDSWTTTPSLLHHQRTGVPSHPISGLYILLPSTYSIFIRVYFYVFLTYE